MYCAVLKADFFGVRLLIRSSARLAKAWTRTATPRPATATRARMNGPDIETVQDDLPLREMWSGVTSPTMVATARIPIGHQAPCATDVHDVRATTPTMATRPRPHTTAT